MTSVESSVYDQGMQDLIDDLIDDGAGLAEWLSGDRPLTARILLVAGMIYIVVFLLFQLL